MGININFESSTFKAQVAELRAAEPALSLRDAIRKTAEKIESDHEYKMELRAVKREMKEEKFQKAVKDGTKIAIPENLMDAIRRDYTKHLATGDLMRDITALWIVRKAKGGPGFSTPANIAKLSKLYL